VLAARTYGLPALAGALLMGSVAASAAESQGQTLQAVLDAAAPGTVVQLSAGTYAGPALIDKTLTIDGGGAVIDGGGRGSVITVEAPDVVLRNLVVRNSGIDLSEQDSGIFVGKGGDRALVENNRVEGNLIGIYLWGPDDAQVRDNTIVGLDDLRLNERGNGIQLWNTPGSVVEDNDVRLGRDGIFVTTSHHNVFRANRFRDVRFAVHYMYTNDSRVEGNVSQGNHLGFAIMFSDRLEILDNRSEGDRDHGLLLNYANGSRIEGNRVTGGAHKCVFIYNANKNDFLGNHFEGCDIGIHFTAGSERNVVSGNAFIDNRTQVKYVGTRHIEWSADGRGNYWSDAPSFDVDGNGIGDRAYHPNDLVDQVLWRHPSAKLLINSPALHLLRWAQAEFPALHPGGVTDSAPLMRPPEREDGDG
jgi:nitrous oxidase accessory protein